MRTRLVGQLGDVTDTPNTMNEPNSLSHKELNIFSAFK